MSATKIKANNEAGIGVRITSTRVPPPVGRSRVSRAVPGLAAGLTPQQDGRAVTCQWGIARVQNLHRVLWPAIPLPSALSKTDCPCRSREHGSPIRSRCSFLWSQGPRPSASWGLSRCRLLNWSCRKLRFALTDPHTHPLWNTHPRHMSWYRWECERRAFCSAAKRRLLSVAVCRCRNKFNVPWSAQRISSKTTHFRWTLPISTRELRSPERGNQIKANSTPVRMSWPARTSVAQVRCAAVPGHSPTGSCQFVLSGRSFAAVLLWPSYVQRSRSPPGDGTFQVLAVFVKPGTARQKAAEIQRDCLLLMRTKGCSSWTKGGIHLAC